MSLSQLSFLPNRPEVTMHTNFTQLSPDEQEQWDILIDELTDQVDFDHPPCDDISGWKETDFTQEYHLALASMGCLEKAKAWVQAIERTKISYVRYTEINQSDREYFLGGRA
jgi:hypothetical protein